MIIGIDFDGTCVAHEYPRVGCDIGAQKVLKQLTDSGHQLILFTMRCDKENIFEKFLSHAVDWFKENGIPLHGIQKNPTQHEWTSSPKAYAQLYIDDAGLGCPLTNTLPDGSLYCGRPFVNWPEVQNMLIEMNVIAED